MASLQSVGAGDVAGKARYFTEVDSRLLAQSAKESCSLFAQKFAEFTSRTVKRARVFLVHGIPSGFTELGGQVNYRDRVFGALHGRHSPRVRKVVVITQPGEVRSLLESRSTGMRMDYLS